jgi:hypothetical protein
MSANNIACSSLDFNSDHEEIDEILSKAAQINQEIEKSRSSKNKSHNRSRSGASIQLSVATSITD